MAGRYLRDSKGRYAGATTGWQKGRSQARKTVSGARKKVSAYNNKVLRQEAFVHKNKNYEMGLTRGQRNARVAAGAAATLAGNKVHPVVGTVGRNMTVGRVARGQQERAVRQGNAVTITRARSRELVRKEFVRSIKVQVGTTAAIGGGAILAGGAMRVGGGLLGAHRAREGSLMANRALGAGPIRSRKVRGVYNVSSMGSKGMGTGSRVRLGGQRMSAAVRYAAGT